MRYCLVFLLLLLTGCDLSTWNNPYPDLSRNEKILYSAITEVPKHFDPAVAYTETASKFISQIYEPPLQYNYHERPYTLEPLVATAMPQITHKNNNTIYTINIKPHIYYQPHRVFNNAKRELIAADYVYQIKRLASPRVNSPIYGFMANYILGLTELRAKLRKLNVKHEVDLTEFTIAGARVIDRYTFAVTIKGNYPQFKYWLAMSFFAPMPWEVIQNNINLDQEPIGTGPYMLTENNPEHRLILSRNPNYQRSDEPEPKIDKAVFSIEKEDIPYWNKFLQGFYDASGISSDNFNQAVTSGPGGVGLTPELVQKGISLTTSVAPTIWFWGFNMLDPVVGGYTAQQKKLRRAIALAFDVEEFVHIFTNNRGVAADSPLPPGIFGYQPPQKSILAKQAKIRQAKQLMREAGYANGIDPVTRKPLVIYYDTITSGAPDELAVLAWMREQFEKINIDLITRATDINRWFAKMNNGQLQFYMLGWNADYPDPENFLFLLYGPNGKVQYNGENSTNYASAAFDKLFVKMRHMPNGVERMQVIDKMLDILQEDRPWSDMYYPSSYALVHKWHNTMVPNPMARNNLKYKDINPQLRAKLQKQWNKPIIWPFILLVLGVIILLLPAVIGYWQKEHQGRPKRR